MYLNIVHRADAGEHVLKALSFQLDKAHELSFKTTILVSFTGILDDKVVEFVKDQNKKYGDEIGIHFHELMCEEIAGIAQSSDPALYLHSENSKEKIITHVFETFRSKFGFIPTAIGGYIIDAVLMKIIKDKYPKVKAAITNCFEEGVRMYEGNNFGWTLFSDGGPWAPFYPSKENYLLPAIDENDAVDVVALPHLNRDMIMALTSRDDYFASHPMNVMRAKANNDADSPYMRKFIDKWIEQINYNGFSYYNLFVSSPWLLDTCPFVDSVENAKALYEDSLRYLKAREKEGLVEAVTMTEFADWYKANIKIGESTVNLWDDLIGGTKRQMFWYVDPYMRAAFDLNAAGSIVDLRPYAGRLRRDLGPDTEALWNGSYPFAISFGLRTGTEFLCKIHYNGKTVSTADRRTKGNISHMENGNIVFTVNPIKLRIDDLEITLQSVFKFRGNGEVEVERNILGLSKEGAFVTLEEYFQGCYGTVQYPEDMRSIELCAESKDSYECKKLNYQYKTRKTEVTSPLAVTAKIPPLNTSIQLISEDISDNGGYAEGSLFTPYYGLFLNKRVSKGGTIKSCLKILSL